MESKLTWALGLGQGEARSKELHPDLLNEGQEPKYLFRHLLPPSHISRKLDSKK